MTCFCGNTRHAQNIPPDKGKSWDELHQLIKAHGNATVHFYVVSTASIEQQKGREYFLQEGSAPNFSGRNVTLCTCKHDLRTILKPEDWRGRWIAGFSGITRRTDRRQYLLYLMRVGKAHKTHRELWRSLDTESRRLKNAAKNYLGDVFKPIQNNASIYPEHYCQPKIGRHVHRNDRNDDLWKNDIYFERNGKSAALLVGDESFSFCWVKPFLYIDAGDLRIGRLRYARKDSLENFVGKLKSVQL